MCCGISMTLKQIRAHGPVNCVWNFPLTWHLRRGGRRQASCYSSKRGQNREKGRKTQTDVWKRHRESLSERLASDSSREVALGWKLESIFCWILANEHVWSAAETWSSQRPGTSMNRKLIPIPDGRISKGVRKECDLGYTCDQQEPEKTNKKARQTHRPTPGLDRFMNKVIDEDLLYDI